MKKRLNIILGWNVIQNEIALPLKFLERTSIFNFNPNSLLHMMRYAGNLYEKFIKQHDPEQILKKFKLSLYRQVSFFSIKY